MPEAGEKEHGEEVGGPETGAAASEREVDVVAEPVRERAVPAAPEVGDVSCSVGGREVLREPDAHAAGQAVCGKPVAAEVKVDAEPEGDVAEPEREDVAARVGGVAEREVVPEAELEEESEDDVAKPPRDVGGAPAEAERAHLGKKAAPAFDRSRHDLRDERLEAEKVEEGREFGRVSRRVHEKADGLKRVE